MEITKIETNFRRKFFWKVSKVDFYDTLENQERQLINLYPEMKFQEIIGFGGAITESSGYCLSRVNPLMANQIMEDYFLKSGMSYSFCRIPIGSCDFSLSSYSYLENENIETFSVERDEKYLIPMLKNALRKNPKLKFLATPWSPPDFMKSNHQLISGGRLLGDYYRAYAQYLTKYILAYQKRGIAIDYITIQNEPNAIQKWESCLFSAEEEAIFARNFLYPEFIKNKINTQIFAWDHNKERLYTRAKKTLDVAGEVISGMAMHCYSGDYFEEIALTRKQYPNHLLFHTEGCTGYSHFRKQDEVKNAEIYAHDMIGDLNAGVNAYLDWNLILNYQGGPNHQKNYCNAPIMLNKNETGYSKNLTYYYIGHFSRFIQPGAKRIGLSVFSIDIEATAFQNKDDSIVLVLCNRNNINREFNLQLNGKIFHDNLDSHAILTFVIAK